MTPDPANVMLSTAMPTSSSVSPATQICVRVTGDTVFLSACAASRAYGSLGYGHEVTALLRQVMR